MRLWGSVAGAIGLHTALWLVFGLFGAIAALLLLVPDTRRFAGARAPAQVT